MSSCEYVKEGWSAGLIRKILSKPSSKAGGRRSFANRWRIIFACSGFLIVGWSVPVRDRRHFSAQISFKEQVKMSNGNSRRSSLSAQIWQRREEKKGLRSRLRTKMFHIYIKWRINWARILLVNEWICEGRRRSKAVKGGLTD